MSNRKLAAIENVSQKTVTKKKTVTRRWSGKANIAYTFCNGRLSIALFPLMTAIQSYNNVDTKLCGKRFEGKGRRT
jgi:hypothetical protein